MTFTKGIGTAKYMAPEILNRERYKYPADVYSFAITMLEIMIWGDAFPKEEFKFPWDIADFICDGKRPSLIEKVYNDVMKKLIQNSWCHDPSERLTIDDIVSLLETILQETK